MTLQEMMNEYGIKHFSEEELRRASHGEIPENYYKNIIPTLLVADYLREKCGFPLRVNSAYRSKEYNATVAGSSPRSLHTKFNALDLSPLHWDIYSISKLIAEVKNPSWSFEYNGKKITPKIMGIGLYDTFIHIDTRGLLKRKAPARWDRRTKV